MADTGKDISATAGLDPAFTLVSESRIVAEAALRRLTTPRGSLLRAPNYGTDLREALLSRLDRARLDAWRARVEAELRKDDRIETVAARLAFDRITGTLSVRVEGTTGATPFAFTLAVTEVTTELLAVE